MMTPSTLRVAVIDLYNGEPNQGMRAIHELLTALDGRFHDVPIEFEVFEARLNGEMPDLSYDVYVSSGGPGSPYDGAGQAWEARYFAWIDAVWAHNARHPQERRKHVLFICHSFQLMVRHFAVADVVERRSPSFGVFPVHPTLDGFNDPALRGLADPFYAADFRHWQAIQPDVMHLEDLGASILALEKPRPGVALERAIMAIRLTPELLGVQFHPEADPKGMAHHFSHADRKTAIIEQHGAEKYARIMHRLQAPAFLQRTYDAVIPQVFQGAVEALRP
ncbi:MAG: GMP synthase, partial [Bacteroidota bacterium]